MKQIPRPSRLRPTVNLVDLFHRLTDQESIVLTAGEDFDCAPSTAAQIIREEWRRLFGDMVAKVDGDTVVLSVDPGKAQRPNGLP